LDWFWEVAPHVLGEAILVCMWITMIMLWRALIRFMARRSGSSEGTFWGAISLPGYLLAAALPFYVYCR